MRDYAKGSPPFWSLRCLLIDHRQDWTCKTQSTPFCSRCGDDGYWPARRTLGGHLERFAYWRRYRWRAIKELAGRGDGIPF